MFAKKNVLAAAIMLFNDEILDEDEMFCVFSKLNRKNPLFPYWNYDHIETQMDNMSSAEIKSEFRFGHSELPLLAEALQILNNNNNLLIGCSITRVVYTEVLITRCILYNTIKI